MLLYRYTSYTMYCITCILSFPGEYWVGRVPPNEPLRLALLITTSTQFYNIIWIKNNHKLYYTTVLVTTIIIHLIWRRWINWLILEAYLIPDSLVNTIVQFLSLYNLPPYQICCLCTLHPTYRYPTYSLSTLCPYTLYCTPIVHHTNTYYLCTTHRTYLLASSTSALPATITTVSSTKLAPTRPLHSLNCPLQPL